MIPSTYHPQCHNSDAPYVRRLVETLEFPFRRDPSHGPAQAWVSRDSFLPARHTNTVVNVEKDDRTRVVIPISYADIIGLNIAVDPMVGV